MAERIPLTDSRRGAVYARPMSFQLWQLLIRIEEMEPGDSLTCTDCFAILDLLLLGAELGLDLERLQQLARDQLAHCPGCRERLLERLKQLEELAVYRSRLPDG